jgi:hypothetical protein
MKQIKRDFKQKSKKLHLDKYYTPSSLAEYVVSKAKEVIGEDNITEYLEPSAGAGIFLDYLPKDTLAYDIEPEDDRIIKQDYLELDLEYKKGRCVIGNPPFGDRCNLYRRFYNKSVELSDYIVFIAPIRLLNNTKQNYKFDLVHSEDLKVNNYSGVSLHCCLNIYKRPKNGLNKPIKNKIEGIEIYRDDHKNYEKIKEDFKICRMGASLGKIDKDVRSFKIVVDRQKFSVCEILNILKNYDFSKFKNISTPYISKSDVYDIIKSGFKNT